jgi:tetratricopeptide (TPR) repeat protein
MGILPMIARSVVYVAVAAAIVGVSVWLNRAHDVGWVRYHIDPQAALSVPSHNHAITGTACECDPDKEIKQAMADRAGYADTHRELGDNFYARGRYEEAQRCYERAIEQDENNVTAQYGLGRVYMKLARFDLARECFARAVESDRRFVNGYVALGLSHYCQGQFEKARDQWETALKFDPKQSYAAALVASLPKKQK